MNSTQNLRRSYTFCDAGETFVDQSSDVACTSACNRHDGALSATVYERFHFMSIDFAPDIKHGHIAERLRCVLHSELHVLLNVLSP